MDYKEMNRLQERIDNLNRRLRRSLAYGIVFPILEVNSPCKARFTIDRVLNQYRIVDADTGEMMPNKAKDFGRSFKVNGRTYTYMSKDKAECFFKNEDAFFSFWED